MAKHSDHTGLPAQVAREQVRRVRNLGPRSGIVMGDLNRDVLGTKKGKKEMIGIMMGVRCIGHERNRFTPLIDYRCVGCPLLDTTGNTCTAGLEVKPRPSHKER